MQKTKKEDKEVIIYSTPTCPWCKKTKEFLTENKIKYKGVNFAENEKARNEMIEKSGQFGVPVIDISGKIFVGFDPGKLKKALGI